MVSENCGAVFGEGVLRHLDIRLCNENGGRFGFVCIWRPGEKDVDDTHARYGVTVGEWLSRPENQSGAWLIDGGWGGPPGPVRVLWKDDRWSYRGFPPWPSDQE